MLGLWTRLAKCTFGNVRHRTIKAYRSCDTQHKHEYVMACSTQLIYKVAQEPASELTAAIKTMLADSN